jgi:Ni,Fe-hydrogenase maturation factor
MKILVFGNPLLKEDNLALKLVPRLKKDFPDIEFKEFEPTEELKDEIENNNLFILDVVEGINKVIIIEDIDKLSLIKSCSMHDFDLAYNLKIFKKIGLIDKVKIIGIPMNMNKKEALREIKEVLYKLIKK